jgi:serine/threonine protein phosphatase PrpC
MEGHGTYGHLVSQHIKSQIVQTFTNASTFKTPKQPELTEAKILSMLLHKNNTLIRKFITNVHQSLLHERFDTNLSGSTCIIVFHILNTLITVNVGDSRAILIKRVFNMKQSCSVFEAEALNSAKTRLIMVMKRRRCIECGLKVKRFLVLQ